MEKLDCWNLHDELSVIQAALLAVEVNPSSEEGSQCEDRKPHERPDRYDAVKTAIAKALRAKKINGILVLNGGFIYSNDPDCSTRIDDSIDILRSMVNVASLREWFASRGFRPRFFFPAEIETTKYLDKSHPRYSAKLAAAVRAWEAMEDKNLMRGKKPIAAMKGWLEMNYREFDLTHKRTSEKDGYKTGDMNEGAISDITKVSNWDAGGAAKTPGG